MEAARSMGRTLEEARSHYLDQKHMIEEDFVVQAEEAVRDLGLSNGDFNQMLKRARRNPFFRLRVEMNLRSSRK